MAGGIISVIYGALLIVAPLIGAVVLTWWIGAYAQPEARHAQRDAEG